MGLKTSKNNSWRYAAVAALALLTVVMTGCGSKAGPTATRVPTIQPANTAAATKAPAVPGAKVSAVIVDFKHADVSAKMGDTVTWTNNGSAPHTVTAGKPGSVGSEFKSGTVRPGSTFSHTFASAGVFDYFCEIHTSMVAKVTVTQ